MKPTKQTVIYKQRVAEILQSHAIPFRERIGVGGVQADFLIEVPDDRLIIVEAKSWPVTEANVNRAVQQLRLYRQAIGTDGALIVLNGPARTLAAGVVGEQGLIDVLSGAAQWRDLLTQERNMFSLGNLPSRSRTKPRVLTQQEISRRAIFAAMPFCGEYDDTFFVAMAYAADCLGAVCLRVDCQDFEGDIVDEVEKLIRDSVAVIADLSESKPNVLYETGFAHALSRPTVHLCSTPLAELPFDVRNWNTVQYSKGSTFALREVLAKRLAALLKDKAAGKSQGRHWRTGL